MNYEITKRLYKIFYLFGRFEFFCFLSFWLSYYQPDKIISYNYYDLIIDYKCVPLKCDMRIWSFFKIEKILLSEILNSEHVFLILLLLSKWKYKRYKFYLLFKFKFCVLLIIMTNYIILCVHTRNAKSVSDNITFHKYASMLIYIFFIRIFKLINY